MAGDCCHAILPYMAQGLNMALEDAATLGSLLSHVQTPHQLSKATAMYERLRKARTSQLLRETKAVGRDFHLADEELQSQRDANITEASKESGWYVVNPLMNYRVKDLVRF